MRQEEGRAQVDERAGEASCELFCGSIVAFVPAVEHALVSKPGEYVCGRKVLRYPLHISLGVQGDEVANLHSRTEALDILDAIFIQIFEFVEWGFGIELAGGVVRYVAPGEVAIVSTILKNHCCVACRGGDSSANEVHARLDCRAHYGAVRYLITFIFK